MEALYADTTKRCPGNLKFEITPYQVFTTLFPRNLCWKPCSQAMVSTVDFMKVPLYHICASPSMWLSFSLQNQAQACNIFYERNRSTYCLLLTITNHLKSNLVEALSYFLNKSKVVFELYQQQITMMQHRIIRPEGLYQLQCTR